MQPQDTDKENWTVSDNSLYGTADVAPFFRILDLSFEALRKISYLFLGLSQHLSIDATTMAFSC